MEVSLEETLRLLEKIIEELEREDLPLEKAINLFEDGLNLVHLYEKKLKKTS